jgi:hypothetical protein
MSGPDPRLKWPREWLAFELLRPREDYRAAWAEYRAWRGTPEAADQHGWGTAFAEAAEWGPSVRAPVPTEAGQSGPDLLSQRWAAPFGLQYMLDPDLDAAAYGHIPWRPAQGPVPVDFVRDPKNSIFNPAVNPPHTLWFRRFVALRFDLGRPIEPQLAEARALLGAAQGRRPDASERLKILRFRLARAEELLAAAAPPPPRAKTLVLEAAGLLAEAEKLLAPAAEGSSGARPEPETDASPPGGNRPNSPRARTTASKRLQVAAEARLAEATALLAGRRYSPTVPVTASRRRDAAAIVQALDVLDMDAAGRSNLQIGEAIKPDSVDPAGYGGKLVEWAEQLSENYLAVASGLAIPDEG